MTKETRAISALKYADCAGFFGPVIGLHMGRNISV